MAGEGGCPGRLEKDLAGKSTMACELRRPAPGPRTGASAEGELTRVGRALKRAKACGPAIIGALPAVEPTGRRPGAHQPGFGAHYGS